MDIDFDRALAVGEKPLTSDVTRTTMYIESGSAVRHLLRPIEARWQIGSSVSSIQSPRRFDMEVF